MTTELINAFQSRKALIDYVADLTPSLEDKQASDILGGAQAAEQRLRLIDPVGYCRSRNFLDGHLHACRPTFVMAS